MIPLPPFAIRTVVAMAFVATALTSRGAAPAAANAGRPTLSLSTSYSADTKVERGAATLGEVSITALQLGVGASSPLGSGQRVGYGVEYGQFHLSRDAGVPLPGDLREVSLPLSLMGSLGGAWSGRLSVRPGWYGTALNSSEADVNVPVLALASYRQNPELTWSVGLRYDAWGRREWLPIAGVNWKFAPDWEFNLGVPRAGVSWQFHPSAIVRVGATVQGGSFHIEHDPRPAGFAGPAFGGTKLDYREIRVGAALELFSADAISLVLDAGAIVNQRFEYHERDYRLSGDTAPYAALAVRARF